MDEYYQTFSDKLGFIKDLSIIDLICNMGSRKPFLISKKLQNNTSKMKKNISSSVFFSRLWFAFSQEKQEEDKDLKLGIIKIFYHKVYGVNTENAYKFLNLKA